jgi:hypothetical protein
MLRREKKQKKWKKYDFALATAYQILEDEKCPKCGMASWHAFSENSEIEFEIQHMDCYACEYKETYEAREKKQKAGRTNHVVAKHIDGEELPGRREFFEELVAKSQREKKEE